MGSSAAHLLRLVLQLTDAMVQPKITCYKLLMISNFNVDYQTRPTFGWFRPPPITEMRT